jgi:hypothetical protein
MAKGRAPLHCCWVEALSESGTQGPSWCVASGGGSAAPRQRPTSLARAQGTGERVWSRVGRPASRTVAVAAGMQGEARAGARRRAQARRLRRAGVRRHCVTVTPHPRCHRGAQVSGVNGRRTPVNTATEYSCCIHTCGHSSCIRRCPAAQASVVVVNTATEGVRLHRRRDPAPHEGFRSPMVACTASASRAWRDGSKHHNQVYLDRPSTPLPSIHWKRRRLKPAAIRSRPRR